MKETLLKITEILFLFQDRIESIQKRLDAVEYSGSSDSPFDRTLSFDLPADLRELREKIQGWDN